MRQGLHRLKVWGAKQASVPSDITDEVLKTAIEKEWKVSDVMILTGRADVKPELKILVDRLNFYAKEMKIKPPPYLFIFDKVAKKNNHRPEYKKAEPGAYSGILSSKAQVIGISNSLIELLNSDHPSMDALMKRVLAVGVHEEGHIANGDSKKRLSPKAHRQREFKADAQYVKLTGDAQPLIDVLQMGTQYQANELKISVDQLNRQLASDPKASHPITPTRIAHMKYEEEHLSKSHRAVTKPRPGSIP